MILAKLYCTHGRWKIAAHINGMWTNTGEWFATEHDAAYAAVKRGWQLTNDRIEDRRALAAKDGRDAGPARPCTCGDTQVLLGKRSYWCGCCFARSVARLLNELPLHRLEAPGL